MRFGLAVAPAQREKLTNLLSELESPEQLKLYLLMAQSGILKGKIEPAAFAAGQAIRLSRETGLEADRARLYEVDHDDSSAGPGSWIERTLDD